MSVMDDVITINTGAPSPGHSRILTESIGIRVEPLGGPVSGPALGNRSNPHGALRSNPRSGTALRSRVPVDAWASKTSAPHVPMLIPPIIIPRGPVFVYGTAIPRDGHARLATIGIHSRFRANFRLGRWHAPG